MDLNLKLKALSRLIHSTTSDAQDALSKEMNKATETLDTENQYDQLESALRVLQVITFRFSATAMQVLHRFTTSIEDRKLAYSDDGPPLLPELSKYRNAQTLIIEAIKVIVKLKYFETVDVFHELLRLSTHRNESVSKAAREGLCGLAEYDLGLFYDSDTRPGIGAAPQLAVVNELESLSDTLLIEHLSAVLAVMEALLSPTMKGTQFGYGRVTLSSSPAPARAGIPEVRARTIALLVRLYGLVNELRDKRRILSAMNGAARGHHGPRTSDAESMIESNVVVILTFFLSLIEKEPFPIVQKIEDYSYWIFHHTRSGAIKATAQRIEVKIAQNAEYEIYKTLVGFEGLFFPWETLKTSDGNHQKTDTLRKERAAQYAQEIVAANYDLWKQRIIRCAQTESDDMATFPIFYYFLDKFARAKPDLAFRLTVEDSELIKPGLIALIRGLWETSERANVAAAIRGWADTGKHLYASVKVFLSVDLDFELIQYLRDKAIEFSDLPALGQIIDVAVVNYEKQENYVLVDLLLLPALREFARRENANWIFDIWYRKEVNAAIADLPESAIDLVLTNLEVLDRIDFQAEEVLDAIAQRFPGKVIVFLCQRLVRERDKGWSKDFEAIPFEFHKLSESLSLVPAEAMRAVQRLYTGDFADFVYGGGKLLKSIFPAFPKEFETELLNLVESGDDKDVDLVLAVLRNYEGEPFLHATCKSIIRATPEDSDYWNEVAIVLQSNGVVMGRLGMVKAYERKREEALPWLDDPNDKVRAFAKSYLANLDKMIVAERKRSEESMALEKHFYGEE